VLTATARASNGTTTTQSNTATATVTNPVLACNTITGGVLSFSGSTMSMTITNNNTYAVTISSIEVTWNHDLGRQQGSNARPINLLNARWGSGTPFWTGNVNSATHTITTFSPSSAATIAASSTPTIVFTFSDPYANIDKTEKIKINLSTPGCENYSIQSPPIP
jgi:hypothetical protein